MNRRSVFLAAASAALALVLLAPGTSSAQLRSFNPYFGTFVGYGGMPGYGAFPGYGFGYSPYANPYGLGYSPYATPYGFGGGAYSPYYNPYTAPAYRPPSVYNPPATSDNPTNTPPSSQPAPTTTAATRRPAMRDSFYPPVKDKDKDTGDAPATVVVQVPADAELWFQGQKTDLTGSQRTFTSPMLERGASYTYDVKARWTEDGKPVEKTRSVKVRAGERTTIDFVNAKD
jgi:uncharacterized protein (TIGR03000 family)